MKYLHRSHISGDLIALYAGLIDISLAVATTQFQKSALVKTIQVPPSSNSIDVAELVLEQHIWLFPVYWPIWIGEP